MHFNLNLMLAMASLMTAAVADEHTPCWCESDTVKRDPGGELSKRFTYEACMGFTQSYPFYHGNKPFKNDTIKLDEENYSGYDNGSGEKYWWLCVARENGLPKSVIGGNEWNKQCINVAAKRFPGEKGVRGRCPAFDFPEPL